GAAVADLAGGDPLALADRAPAGADLVEQQALAGGEFVFGGPERVLGGVEAVPEGGGDLDVDVVQPFRQFADGLVGSRVAVDVRPYVVGEGPHEVGARLALHQRVGGVVLDDVLPVLRARDEDGDVAGGESEDVEVVQALGPVVDRDLVGAVLAPPDVVAGGLRLQQGGRLVRPRDVQQAGRVGDLPGAAGRRVGRGLVNDPLGVLVGELGADGGLVLLAPVHDGVLLGRGDEALLAVPEGEPGLVGGEIEDGGDLTAADPIGAGGVPLGGAGFEPSEDGRPGGRGLSPGLRGRRHQASPPCSPSRRSSPSRTPAATASPAVDTDRRRYSARRRDFTVSTAMSSRAAVSVTRSPPARDRRVSRLRADRTTVPVRVLAAMATRVASCPAWRMVMGRWRSSAASTMCRVSSRM